METNKTYKKPESLEMAFQRLEEIKNLTQSGRISLDDITLIAEEAEMLKNMLLDGLNAIQNITKEKNRENQSG